MSKGLRLTVGLGLHLLETTGLGTAGESYAKVLRIIDVGDWG